MTPEEIERLAHKRAKAKLGWFAHAAVYLLVNGFLFASYYFGLRSHPWSFVPMLGWGLGLALHGVSVFLLGVGSSLHGSLVQRERDRIQRQQNGS